MSNILIVEDEPIIRTALRKLLERHEYTITEVESVEDAQAQDLSSFALIISDLRLPGAPGSDLISLASPTPVLIMTSYAGLKSAVDVMRDGAIDYIPKPFDHNEMVSTVKRILDKTAPQRRPMTRPAHTAAPRAPQQQKGSALLGASSAVANILKQAERVAKVDTPVLILGEASTGKKLLAEHIHANSTRKQAPMVVVNCATLTAIEQEIELFGCEAGELSGATEDKDGLVQQAHGGTLLLSKIEALSDSAQGRLLRLLESGNATPVGGIHSTPVDVRLIATTSTELADAVTEHTFRQDLYYRLNVVPLTMPPLRERTEDIAGFAESLLAELCNIHQRENLALSKEAQEALRKHAWPGNFQELKNAIERAIIFTEDNSKVSVGALALNTAAVKQENKSAGFSTDPDEELSLEDYFTRFVLEKQDTMTETELAQKLGISRKSLWERRQRLGIPRSRGT